MVKFMLDDFKRNAVGPSLKSPRFSEAMIGEIPFQTNGIRHFRNEHPRHVLFDMVGTERRKNLLTEKDEVLRTCYNFGIFERIISRVAFTFGVIVIRFILEVFRSLMSKKSLGDPSSSNKSRTFTERRSEIRRALLTPNSKSRKSRILPSHEGGFFICEIFSGLESVLRTAYFFINS